MAGICSRGDLPSYVGFALNFNPLPALLAWQDEALHYFVHRDLLGEQVPGIEMLWALPQVTRLVQNQLGDGSWKYAGKTFDPDTGQNYYLLETYRNIRVLVEMYGMNREHPALALAAEYFFSCQTDEGDIRGLIGNQYMPYYHGAILELLIKAGYTDDERVNAGLDWLLRMRQEDGGWIVPAQAVPSKERTPAFWSGDPVMPPRSLPHAHLATGMVLRAFVAHPGYNGRVEVLTAGNCLKSRLFQGDAYGDRKAPAYWLKFQFPFWWNSLLTALDTLAKLGLNAQDTEIGRGLDWFIAHQVPDGLWPTGYGSGKQAESNRRWVGLAICRVLKGYF